MLRADLTVLAQIPARLPHEPDRAHVGGPAPAGIQKTAVHWKPRACLFLCVFAEERANTCWFVFGGPGAAIDEKRLGPGFAVERARCDGRHREHALRRPAGSRVHDVAVDAALGMEKLFVVARCRHRFVLQDRPQPRSCSRPWVADLHSPALLARRRAQAIDAASRRRDQRRVNTVLLQDSLSSDRRRTLFRCRPGPIRRPARVNRTVRLAASNTMLRYPTRSSAPRISARCGSRPVPL